MSNYQVIDDVLHTTDFLEIKSQIMNINFPLFFSNYVVGDKDENLEHFYFTHLIYENHRLNSSQEYWRILTPLLKFIKAKAIIRIKVNAYPNVNKFLIHNPHADYSFEHKGALYSLNNCNGYTILEDGTKIESKENRLLLFDSSKNHQSTTCTDQKMRYNININYL